MNNLLPSQTGLTVEGVFHKYTIVKNPTTNSIVSITNKKVGSEEYIYEYVDDWSNLPSGTKIKYDPTAPTLGNLFGDGEIKVTGDGSLSDVLILYHYKFDPCHTPLSDPSCPDFKDALYQYLLDNNLLDAQNVQDPYYNKWVQIQLDEQAEIEELEAEEAESEEDSEELTVEEILSVAGVVEKIADPMQQLEMMQQLAAVGKLELYFNLDIDGGVYEDVLKIDGGEIKDNVRAWRSLGQDSVHRSMVRSQYDD
tara:strand:- start:1253 stop:2011 length:759 start_codon:yes stop_codon:yes gene_type:complete